MRLELTYSELQVLRTAREKFGRDNELRMAKEECAETIVELCHFDRGRVDIDRVVEEFGDAFVCVAQAVLSETGSLDSLEEAIAVSLGKLNLKILEGDINHRDS